MNGCPKDAVSMIKDDYGFFFPVIKAESCVHCGICERICPCLRTSVNREIREIVAAASSENEIRENSSSGGLFSMLAKSILEKNGVVVGCKLDDDCKGCSHVYITDENDLWMLRGSKYIQSDVKDIYRRVKAFLQDDRPVLFCGTPCQTAGLKCFLGREYDHLLAVDFVCHGVASPVVWNKYLDYAEKEHGAGIRYACFRDKSYGWRLFSVRLEFQDSTKKTIPLTKSLFMRGYIENLFLRESCYSCLFKGDNYYSDITMSDFWGIEDIKPESNDNRGASLAICHSGKGLSYVENLQDCSLRFRVDEDAAFRKNPAYYKGTPCNYWRNKALQEFLSKPFPVVTEKYCGPAISAKVRRKLSKILCK